MLIDDRPTPKWREAEVQEDGHVAVDTLWLFDTSTCDLPNLKTLEMENICTARTSVNFEEISWIAFLFAVETFSVHLMGGLLAHSARSLLIRNKCANVQDILGLSNGTKFNMPFEMKQIEGKNR